MSTYIVTLPVPKSQRIKYICPKTFLSLNMVYSYGKEARGIPSPNKNKTSPSLTEVPLSPFPRKRAPRRLPPAGGTSRSRSAGAFPNCATRFRGGALRHAKFPKTSYKVQLLDTLKHAACVSQNSGRGRGLIFLSSKVLLFFWQNVSILSELHSCVSILTSLSFAKLVEVC